MVWSATTEGASLVARPNGRIDERNWQVFSDSLVAAIETARVAGLAMVVDLATIDYMSSRGLRSLSTALVAAKAASVPMVLAAPGPAMREILAISRYDKLFRVYESVTAAMDAGQIR
jgi:anti-sigma B factor antagonist